MDGYHSILLEEKSQPLMAFSAKWGCVIYLRMLQGYLASVDAYTCRYDEIIKDILLKVKVVNDTLLFDKNIGDGFYQYSRILVTM